MANLTDKQKRFVDEYLKDLNATQAAIRSGYSEATANKVGPRQLVNVGIQQAIQAGYQGLVDSGHIATPEQVLGGYTQDINFDPRKLFDKEGNPVPIPDLPDEIALSLAGFEVIETVQKAGDDEVVLRRVYKYKLPDKKGNRDSLGKYHQLFIERHEITGKDGGTIKAQVFKSILDDVCGDNDEGLPNGN